ncbi:Ctf8-domain-containing protein [Lipomyces oligophaga]|uniref:Ctf8-domain-containing protein n=1 Tax=Lipomyces oligophaga TaxID=45792 RepID=UPI0034CE32CF
MPSALLSLDTRLDASTERSQTDLLSQVIQTPSGLALMEIQGLLHIAPLKSDDLEEEAEIGRLTFEGQVPWLWIGNHQRLEGKLVDLKQPVGVMRRQDDPHDLHLHNRNSDDSGNGYGNHVEFVEVIRRKIVFSTRPEPLVGSIVF